MSRGRGLAVSPAGAAQTLTALSKIPKQIARIARGANDRQLHRKPAVLGYATRILDHEVRHLDQLRRTLGT